MVLQADSLDDSGTRRIDSEPVEAASNDRVRDVVSTPRLTVNQQRSVDARKRKVIDIPMV